MNTNDLELCDNCHEQLEAGQIGRCDVCLSDLEYERRDLDAELHTGDREAATDD